MLLIVFVGTEFTTCVTFVDDTKFYPFVMFVKVDCDSLGFGLMGVELCFDIIRSWNIICRETIGVLLLWYH